MPGRFRFRSFPRWALVPVLSLAWSSLSSGCDERHGGPMSPPAAWEPIPAGSPHRARQAKRAGELRHDAVRVSSDPNLRARALRAAAIAGIRADAALEPTREGDGWPVSAYGLLATEANARAWGSLRESLASSGNLPAAGSAAVNEAVAMLGPMRTSFAPEGEDAVRLLGRASELLAVPGALPEAALNLAAVNLALARLESTPERRIGRLRDADAALARLTADALEWPLLPGEFLGAAPRGPRVVYVIDCSASMGGVSLDAIRLTLMRSIDGLPAGSRFGVITFSDQAMAMPLGGGSGTEALREVRAGSAPSGELRSWMDAWTAAGDGEGALAALALAADWAPDTLFFVTDGPIQDSAGQTDAIAERLSKSGAAVHASVVSVQRMLDAGVPLAELQDVPARLARAGGHEPQLFREAPEALRSGVTVEEALRARGAWSPALERQSAVILAERELLAASDPSGRSAPSALEATGARKVLDRLVRSLDGSSGATLPEPLGVDPWLPGEPVDDADALLLVGALRAGLGEDGSLAMLDAADRFAARAEATTGPDRPYWQERCARALLLAALAKPAMRDAARRHAESLGVLDGTWSGALIRSIDGGLAGLRARRMAERLADPVAMAEHRAVTGTLNGEAMADADRIWIGRLPVAEADVLLRAGSSGGRAALPSNSP